MSKPLSVLLNALWDANIIASVEGEGKYGEETIENLVFDSRRVRQHSLFFALPGTHTDGSKYIDQAVQLGAAAVVYQGGDPRVAEGVSSGEAQDAAQKCKGILYGKCTFIKVENARQAMAPIASAFYDNPSRRLIVIGVTGTEGKSSTVSFIWQLLRKAGRKAGFLSTVEYSIGGDAIPNPEHQTTPEAPIVQERLAQMAASDCEYAVLEASSHALSPRNLRLGCVLFDCAVFMNVTLEHLEFHGTFEQYRDDKANLFRALDAHKHKKIIAGMERQVPSVGVVNADDKSAPYFAKATRQKVLSFGTGTEGAATLMASNVVSDVHGLSFDMTLDQSVADSGNSANESVKVTAPLPGAFNALNLMASFLAVGQMTGIDVRAIVPMASSLTPIHGRMTIIDEGQPFEVIIDYAHTPSSFKMVLPPIAKRCKGQVIAVFGSGGERDRVKRPLQGEVAAAYCRKVILTNEDPRKEDEMQILKEIAQGAMQKGKKEGEDLFLIPDRVEAIRFAFSLAQEGDIVLLLGKGHENSIIGKDGPVPYDEEEAARSLLNECNSSFFHTHITKD